jgi:hypothetical protein
MGGTSAAGAAGQAMAGGQAGADPSTTPYIVKGVSGKSLTLNRRWDRGCVPGTVFAPDAKDGVWVHDERTLTGLVLVTTLTEYHNTSAQPDCTSGQVNTTTFTQILTNDNVEVPFTWVDANGAPATAPAGLEGVTTSNGATGLMTSASRTPTNQPGTDDLNASMFCGLTGWKVGEAKDLLDCFTGGVNPAKGTILVDDREDKWKIYDGIGGDPNAYPSMMPNTLPHTGPFD